MQRHHLFASGAIALGAVALIAVGCGSDQSAQPLRAGAQTQSAPDSAAKSEPLETVPASAPSVALDGTPYSVPVPPQDLGSNGWRLDFGKQAAGDVVTGWSWDKPGPIRGTRVGGVSVTFVGNELARSGDVKAIARDANSTEPAFETSDIDGLTIISWPSSKENVPAGELPGVEDRPVERYVIVLPDGRLDVVFDDASRAAIDSYLAQLAKAVKQ